MIHLTLDDVRQSLGRRRPKESDPTDRIQAAVAIILAPGSDGLAVLLIKRAARVGDPWSGQMAFPGGRRDRNDGSLRATAVREAREETSVALDDATMLGALDDLSPTIEHLPRMLVRPYVHGLLDRPAVVPNGEVAAHRWVPLSQFAAAHVTEDLSVRGERMRVGGYRLGEDLVWGMTERILTPFLELIGAL